MERMSIFRPERQVLTAYNSAFPQFPEAGQGVLDIREGVDFADIFSHELFPGVTQHIDQKGVDVADRFAAGIQNQNALPHRFEEHAMTQFGISD